MGMKFGVDQQGPLWHEGECVGREFVYIIFLFQSMSAQYKGV